MRRAVFGFARLDDSLDFCVLPVLVGASYVVGVIHGPSATILAHPEDILLAGDLRREVLAQRTPMEVFVHDALQGWADAVGDVVALFVSADLLRTLGAARIEDLVEPLARDERLLVVVHGVRLGSIDLGGAENVVLPDVAGPAWREGLVTAARRIVERAEASSRPPHVQPGLSDVLFDTLDRLELNGRVTSILATAGIDTVGDLVVCTEAGLLRLPSFGRTSLQEVKSALAGLGLRLGMDMPDWPPHDPDAARLDRGIADRLSRLRQSRGGARFEPLEDRLAMVAEGDADDLEAAVRPVSRQLQAAVREKARRFAETARRLDNQPGWSGVARAAAGLAGLVDRPAEDVPEVLGLLYASAMELGSFVEQDERLSGGAPSYSLPLDAETRRPLDDLVRTLAPWIRAFPTVREMDDEAGRFLLETSRLEPAVAVVRDAREVELLAREDAAVLERLEDAAARGAFQGAKAGGRVHRSALNLVAIVGMQAAIFLSSAVSSDYATTSPLTHRIGQFLTRAEVDIQRLVADAAPDLRIAIEGLLAEIGGRGALPSRGPRVVSRRRVDGRTDASGPDGASSDR